MNLMAITRVLPCRTGIVKAGTIGVGGSIGIAEKSVAISNTREVRVGIGICEARRAIAARLYTRRGDFTTRRKVGKRTVVLSAGSIDSLPPESSLLRGFVHVARFPAAPFPPGTY
jgi:hypothetical protein